MTRKNIIRLFIILVWFSILLLINNECIYLKHKKHFNSIDSKLGIITSKLDNINNKAISNEDMIYTLLNLNISDMHKYIKKEIKND